MNISDYTNLLHYYLFVTDANNVTTNHGNYLHAIIVGSLNHPNIVSVPGYKFTRISPEVCCTGTCRIRLNAHKHVVLA